MADEVPDEESLTLEALIVQRVTAAVAEDLDALAASILKVFENFGVGLMTSGELGTLIFNAINRFKWDPMKPDLLLAAETARDFGQSRAVYRFTDSDERERAAALSNWRQFGLPDVPDIDRAVTEGLAEAARLANAGIRTRRDAASVAGKIRATRARAQGTARYVANEGINAGTAEVARAMNLRLLWVTERNGCLHCLGHAGYAVEVGGNFPARLSFDPRGSKFPAVPHPPLHPNCRCQVRTYEGDAGPPSTDRSLVDPAARLAAEARRSVVYQWTDYASGPAAQRAAEALLSAGAALPSSVQKRARTAIRKGGVPRPAMRRQK